MSKAKSIPAIILAEVLVISFLHIWLNIGFDKIGLAKSDKAESFRVGFLPVT